jgi:hypothetical protein
MLPLLGCMFFLYCRNEMSTGLGRGFGSRYYHYSFSVSVEMVETRLTPSPTTLETREMGVGEQHSDRRKTKNGIPRIAVAVMGEARVFSRWFHTLSEQVTHSKQLSFIYGAYDDKEKSDENQQRCKEQVHFQTCHADFIPNTTWTQGRNILARHILTIEEQQDQEFDFWIFADDDLDLVVDSSNKAKKSQGETWQDVLQQLDDAYLLSANKISQFTVFRGKANTLSQGGWVGVSTYDANFAIFSRWAVPYLLPYTTPRPGDSEWISQAALFCITQTCFPSSVAVIPGMSSYNPLHRKYERNRFVPEAIGDAIQDSIGSYLDLNKFCTHADSSQFQDPTGKFPNVAELENALPSSPRSAGLCEPLAVRFRDWGRQTTTL